MRAPSNLSDTRECRGARLIGALWLLTLPVQPAAAGSAPTTIDTSEFGAVELHGPRETAKGFVFLFSGDLGLSAEDRKAIQGLVGAGYLLAAIDTRAALRGLDQPDPEQDCIELPGPLEWVSHRAQHDFKLARYLEPVLLGRETGGALVYAALAQAPPLSFAGGMSVDFTPIVTLDRKFCDLVTMTGGEHRQRLAPIYRLRGWWQVAGTTRITPEVIAFAEASAIANNTKRSLIPAPAPLHDLYIHSVEASLNRAAVVDKTVSVADLPVVEVSSTSTNGTLAIIYSGDGGWRDIDKTLGDLLTAKGVAVLGVDALRYFWSRLTPEQTATDLARLITHYSEAWDLNRIVLIGYSFGADILPFAYNRLPEEPRNSVIMLSLLAPARAADFEIKIFGWLSAEPGPEALSTLPEVRKIDPRKLQCIYGVEELDETLCTVDVLRRAEVIERPGSHHFDENYAALADTILAGISRRASAGTGSHTPKSATPADARRR